MRIVRWPCCFTFDFFLVIDGLEQEAQAKVKKKKKKKREDKKIHTCTHTQVVRAREKKQGKKKEGKIIESTKGKKGMK